MEEKKKKRLIDKIIMGAIIGGAIGSVLGATMAPKELAGSAKEKTKSLFYKVVRLIKRDKDLDKKIPTEK
ncbi:hypothetical protein HYW82_00665 [Candidatus Peregrinibacteria bacterium]|nr:hypothetical protein [Candidatus Peregrinibacteria bacterium]